MTLAYLASGDPSSRNRAATGSTLSGNSRRTWLGPMSSTTDDRWRAVALRTCTLRCLQQNGFTHAKKYESQQEKSSNFPSEREGL